MCSSYSFYSQLETTAVPKQVEKLPPPEHLKSSDSSKSDSPLLPHSVYTALTKSNPKHFKRKPGWRTDCPEPKGG